jgi:hypothetical protein
MGTLLLAGLLAASSMGAPAAGPRRETLSAAATRIARHMPIDPPAARQAGKSDWNKVRVLLGSRVRVKLRSGMVKEGLLETIDDDRLVLASTNDLPVPVARQDIAEVGRPMRGSIIGGVLGVAAGAVAGVASAFHFGFKQCGDSCQDESVLMLGSLIGMPLAGGYAGAYLGARGRWVVVYRG